MIRIALLMLVALPAWSQPATERYAPVQLQVAQAALDRAERLLRRGEGAAARRLAAQASLDARLAWTMTDSPFLRTEAAALYERSARLDFNGAIAAAKDLGVDASEAASAAATGALRAAGEVGAETLQQVQNAATGVISGVKVVASEPFRK